jgi:hypothetical protein
MPEPPKKRLCLRCGDNKEYAEDAALCAADHDIALENYLFKREDDQRKKAADDAEKNKPKSLLGNLSKAVRK